MQNQLKHNKNVMFALTCVASVGVLSTAILAVRATPKALNRIQEDSKKKHDGNPDAYTYQEAVCSGWKYYIPSALVGFGTISCIVSMQLLDRRQQAMFSSAYTLLHSSYHAYKNKIKEYYGQEKHRQILKEFAVEKAKSNPIYAGSYFGFHTLGLDDIQQKELLFYDSIGERYFTSTLTKVLEAEYHLNRNFCLGWTPSLNDFYELLGLEKTEVGDAIGWTNTNGDYYWIDFFHTHTDVDGSMDCWVIDVDQRPTAEFLDE